MHIFFQRQSFIDIFSEAAARSLKNNEMFPEAATQTKNNSCIFFFQKQSFIDISSEAAARSLKKH